MQPAAEAFDFTWDGQIEFENAQHASYVCQVLSVDPELRPQEVERELTTNGAVFFMTFKAKQPRMLRAAVGTFLDLVALAIRTLEAFKGTEARSSGA